MAFRYDLAVCADVLGFLADSITRRDDLPSLGQKQSGSARAPLPTIAMRRMGLVSVTSFLRSCGSGSDC
jgi:hypothetical protein